MTPEVFTRDELRRYEEKILDNKSLTEQEASRFFQDSPKFLTVGGYLDIAREVVLYKGDDVMYRVDFVRRKAGERFWDFVELKGPDTPFVVKQGTHWTFGAKINAAVNQGQDYKDFLDEESNRINLELRTGIKALRPRLLIVGGRDNNSIHPEELRKLADRYSNVDIKNYDDLYQFAKENYEYGSGIIVVPSLQGHLPGVPIFGQVQLRSKPLLNLTDDAATKMLRERGFYERDRNEAGRGLQHDYKVLIRSGDKLVRDNATGLTWQQAGSSNSYQDTYQYSVLFLDDLNHEEFGGYSDWRFPTLEEAMSLMQSEKKNHQYIAPVFHNAQWRIWTSDEDPASVVWGVHFRDGYCYHAGVNSVSYLRAVR